MQGFFISPFKADRVRMIKNPGLVTHKKTQHLEAVERKYLPLAQQRAGTEQFIPFNHLRAVFMGTDGPLFTDDAHGAFPRIADAHIVGHGNAPVVTDHPLQLFIP